MTWEIMVSWVADIPNRPERVFAIRAAGVHVGNIALNTITEDDAELSILLGKGTWGRGVGGAAVKQATDYAFETLGLESAWAESPNPAFNAIMRNLNWQHIGQKPITLRDRPAQLDCWRTANAQSRIPRR